MNPLATLARAHWQPHHFSDAWVLLVLVVGLLVLGLAFGAALDGDRAGHKARKRARRARHAERATGELPRAVARPRRS